MYFQFYRPLYELIWYFVSSEFYHYFLFADDLLHSDFEKFVKSRMIMQLFYCGKISFSLPTLYIHAVRERQEIER